MFRSALGPIVQSRRSVHRDLVELKVPPLGSAVAVRLERLRPTDPAAAVAAVVLVAVADVYTGYRTERKAERIEHIAAGTELGLAERLQRAQGLGQGSDGIRSRLWCLQPSCDPSGLLASVPS